MPPVRPRPTTPLLPTAAACLLLGALAAAPAPAVAKGDGNGRQEVRVAGHCGSGASAKLKLKADDGAIEVEFEVEVDHNRVGTRWRVTLVRERRVVARATARTHGPSGSFTIIRRLRDLAGSDRVTARASGPGGLRCEAAATLPA